MRRLSPLILAIAVCFAQSDAVAAAEDAKQGPHSVPLAGGKMSMTAPATWTRKKPKVRFIEHEFALAAAKGDTTGGRLTIMQAGGGVKANVARWQGQFAQPKGQTAKVSKQKIAGQTVHLIDIAGTYSDRRGPFAPAVKRPDYRMLAAIIEAQTTRNGGKVPLGTYYIKLYGPKKTIASHEKDFKSMVKSLKQAK
jgi:hypothetical protein